MPRQLRFRIPAVTYLVHQRGHNNTPVFLDDLDYREYLDGLRESTWEVACPVHAYALMPHHVLLLCTPSSADGVSKLMQSVGSRYAATFNRVHGRTGSLWDGRYRACLVEPSRYVLAAHRFVESQPERLGYVDSTTRHRWTSYHAHTSQVNDSLLQDHWAYRNLGATGAARTKAYRELFQLPLSQSILAEVGHAVSHSLVLGSERFKDEMDARVPGRVRLGNPGRPPKRIPLPRPYGESGATA